LIRSTTARDVNPDGLFRLKRPQSAAECSVAIDQGSPELVLGERDFDTAVIRVFTCPTAYDGRVVE
jgi:hypothetical protein